MAKYWVFLNNKVLGPYELEQLIRLPGFSRQTLVSVDDFSDAPPRWISPAAIPELARIFQKVDELHDSPLSEAAPRPAPKLPKPRMPARLTPVPPPVEPARHFPWGWLVVFLLAALAGAGAFHWNQKTRGEQFAEERETAQTLVETAPLPRTSLYSTLRQYLQIKAIASRWEFKRLPSGLYNVTVSWPATEKPAVYAFEANLQAQSLRGINTAAMRLLAEGFPAPKAAKPEAASPPRHAAADMFPGAINDRRQAVEQGDFETMWQTFSRRRQKEMAAGGLDQSSFVRMQKLTYRASRGLQQTIVKTKVESDTRRLVLLRQSQPKHPDMYIKQNWVWEDNHWRLDEEEKKIPASLPPATAEGEEPPAPSAAPAAEPSTPPPDPSLVPRLPGVSDPSAAPR